MARIASHFSSGKSFRIKRSDAPNPCDDAGSVFTHCDRHCRAILRDDELWKQRDSPSTVACVLPSLSSVRGALDLLKMPELTVSFGGGLTPHRAFLEPRS